MTWVLAIGGIVVLVVLHELGHFARREGGRDAGRALLPLLPAEAGQPQARARPSTGSARSRSGGFVKITGMNPDEELPPEVAKRGYYHMPVWKRIFVIGAGPAVNILIAFLILFGARASASRSRTASRRRHRAGHAGRRAASRPATRSSRSTASARRLASRSAPSELSSQIATHQCAGERGATAAERRARRRSWSTATASARRSRSRPYYDAEFERYRLGFRFEPRATSQPRSIGEAAELAPTSCGSSPRRPSRPSPRSSSRRSASSLDRSPARYEATRQAFDFSTTAGAAADRRDQPLAGADQPVPVPAARRRPHLLEPGREGARQAGPVQGDGAGERRRLPARAVHLLHRALERHRALLDRHLRFALSRSSAIVSAGTAPSAASVRRGVTDGSHDGGAVCERRAGQALSPRTSRSHSRRRSSGFQTTTLARSHARRRNALVGAGRGAGRAARRRPRRARRRQGRHRRADAQQPLGVHPDATWRSSPSAASRSRSTRPPRPSRSPTWSTTPAPRSPSSRARSSRPSSRRARTCPTLETVIVVDGEGGELHASRSSRTKGADFDASSRLGEVGPDDLLTLIYTSGTTGPPKGVQLSHRNLMGLVAGVEDLIELPERGGKVISWLPAAHIAERGAQLLPAGRPTGSRSRSAPTRARSSSSCPRCGRPGSSPCRGSGRS